MKLWKLIIPSQQVHNYGSYCISYDNSTYIHPETIDLCSLLENQNNLKMFK